MSAGVARTVSAGGRAGLTPGGAGGATLKAVGGSGVGSGVGLTGEAAVASLLGSWPPVNG